LHELGLGDPVTLTLAIGTKTYHVLMYGRLGINARPRNRSLRRLGSTEAQPVQTSATQLSWRQRAISAIPVALGTQSACVLVVRLLPKHSQWLTDANLIDARHHPIYSFVSDSSMPPPFSGIAQAKRNARMLQGEQMLWWVYEFAPAFDRRRGPVLVFESDTVVRTVRRFPSSWRTLSDEELLALSERP
jgi:hypothetical protein